MLVLTGPPSQGLGGLGLGLELGGKSRKDSELTAYAGCSSEGSCDKMHRGKKVNRPSWVTSGELENELEKETENPRTKRPQVTSIKCSSYSRHNSKVLSSINSYNSHNHLARGAPLVESGTETGNSCGPPSEAQGQGPCPGPPAVLPPKWGYRPGMKASQGGVVSGRRWRTEKLGVLLSMGLQSWTWLSGWTIILGLWLGFFFVAVVCLLCGCAGSSLPHWLSLVVVLRFRLPRGMWDLSPSTKNWTCVPQVGRLILNQQTTREVPGLGFSLHLIIFVQNSGLSPHWCPVSCLGIIFNPLRYQGDLGSIIFMTLQPSPSKDSHRQSLILLDHIWPLYCRQHPLEQGRLRSPFSTHLFLCSPDSYRKSAMGQVLY